MAHTHDHAPDPANDPSFDPAAQSLADALRVSFGLLKWVMVILIVVYCFSNVRNVATQETGVRLRFGKVIASDLPAGGPYFAFPFPFEEVFEVTIKPRDLTLNKSFWFEVSDADTGKTVEEIAEGKMGPLNPEKDGSLITGDSNIVHTRWSLTYRISDSADYVENVGNIELADKLVRMTAEGAVVHAMAELSADDLLKGVTNAQAVKRYMQRALDQIGAGLTVEQVSLAQLSVPLSTRPAFQAVLNAENEKSRAIETAQEERVNILSAAAGEAHGQLLGLIGRFERASEAEDAGDDLAAVNVELQKALDSLMIDGVQVSGEVATIINEAQGYRTSVVEQVKAEAQKLNQLYAQYKKNPRIIKQRLIQETKQEILSSLDNETFYVTQNSQFYLELNRDPKVKRDRETRRLQSEEIQRQMQAGQ